MKYPPHSIKSTSASWYKGTTGVDGLIVLEFGAAFMNLFIYLWMSLLIVNLSIALFILSILNIHVRGGWGGSISFGCSPQMGEMRELKGGGEGRVCAPVHKGHKNFREPREPELVVPHSSSFVWVEGSGGGWWGGGGGGALRKTPPPLTNQ